MAVFGRRTARQRMRRATQQALSVPTFRTTMDCTPWVLGGLWPAELQQVNSETAPIATYLKNDLQRIADSANERLRAIADAGLEEQVRQAEENRILNVARAFAVLRVESTVRQLRKEPLGFRPDLPSLGAPHWPERSGRPEPEPVPRPEPPPAPSPEFDPTSTSEPEPATTGEPDSEPAPLAEPEGARVVGPRLGGTTPLAEPDEPEPVALESERARLTRLVRFVARQEPRLRWAIGRRRDGTVVLVTDLAHGWIPPGIALPADTELLPPGRHTGGPAALLADAEEVVSYRPGDSFGVLSAASSASSGDPRRLPDVGELPRRLSEVTRGRPGLPRLTHALAASIAAGDSVVDAEVDVLRVHLDTARYQLLAHYPDLDGALFLNCLLLAATEALAGGDHEAANYHYAWFAALNGPAGH